MIKLEIRNINDVTNYDIPRLELWLISPREMIVEASAVREYLTDTEMLQAFKELSKRKAELEIEYNHTEPEYPSYPKELKQRLHNSFVNIASRLDDIEKIEAERKAEPRARIIK